MLYVDCFMFPMPKKNLATYRKMAKEGGRQWMKYGALQYAECIGEDMAPGMMGMKYLPFPKMVKVKPDETIVFSYIVFKSKAHRNKVNAMVMKDSSMDDPKNKNKPMPFEIKRMSYGGFTTIVYQ